MKLFIICLIALFNQANEQYAAGEYAEAAATYEQILVADSSLTDNSKAIVYYNLGNAYFRTGELSQSILAYERCLRLRPTFRDARYNLRFAQSRIVDNIEDNQAFFLSNALKFVRNLLTYSTWLGLSISLFVLTLVGLLLFALMREPWLRKTAFFTAIIAFIISICAAVNAASLHSRDTNRAEAIITQGIVNAKASPDRSGTDLFTLHEGTKVTIHEVIGDWCNIHVGNNVGWIKLSNLERI
ncbi:MAG: tetratricopeptide repeat protein [Paludibacteraceae bacterium]|nr:tetratricopeptide repeat protein [Paludibacteraceae bacterium]MBQ4391427.1 tetratricopeptide repeat protein [Paludibacteraceae bacterium]